MTKMHLAGIVGIAAIAAGCHCHAAAGASAWLYPQPAAVRAQAFAAKGLRLCDFHIHLRGGMSVEKGLARERASGIASAFIANHGRGWKIVTNNFDDRVPSLDAWFAALDALGLPPSRLLAY